MNEVKINCVYKHFKGDYYLVEDIAINSENGELYVVYRALYGDNLLYIRPLKMFASLVDHEKYPNVSQKYRFELQNIKSKKWFISDLWNSGIWYKNIFVCDAKKINYYLIGVYRG